MAVDVAGRPPTSETIRNEAAATMRTPTRARPQRSRVRERLDAAVSAARPSSSTVATWVGAILGAGSNGDGVDGVGVDDAGAGGLAGSLVGVGVGDAAGGSPAGAEEGPASEGQAWVGLSVSGSTRWSSGVRGSVIVRGPLTAGP